MGVKWLIFLVVLWIILAAMGLILNGDYPGVNESSTLNVLLALKDNNQEGFHIPVLNAAFATAFWNVLSFDFSYFRAGFWKIFQYLFYGISIAIAINIAYSLASLVRGGGSAST